LPLAEAQAGLVQEPGGWRSVSWSEAARAAAGQIKEKVRRLGRITRLELATNGSALPPMLDLEKSSQGLDDGR